MKFYWIRTPKLLAWLLRRFEWRIRTTEKKIYLTFDDGPVPEATPLVLDLLDQYDAKASFFCIGDNVAKHPELFERVWQSGHAIGNHTYHHIKGWETEFGSYMKEVADCAAVIASGHHPEQKIMRPPYAKVTWKQSGAIKKQGYRIVMWDVLSADFDQRISPQQCLDNVIKNIRPGSIVIFHDSQKARKNMEFALKGTLEFMKKNGYRSESLY